MSIVITRAPFRVSFFGGGSDYPTWFRREPGAVLSTTIDKYVYISCRYLPPFLGIRHRVVWRHVELIDTIAEILHPAIREGLRYLDFDDSRGIELHYQGDLPARSGVGSSSSFAVGLIQALMCLRGREVDKHKLAEMAIELEQVRMKDTVGSQDQVAAAYGGINVIKFHCDGSFEVNPLALSETRERELLQRLMLFFPGRSRLSSQIAISVTQNLVARADSVRRMVGMVDEGARILLAGNLDDFGRLLHEAWLLKRGLSEQVSSLQIDDLYARARAAGATGGKLLGAGSTGFLLLYAPPERHEAISAALPGCIEVPFALDRQGSCIIYQADGAQDYPWH
jgi:D-glycero-alpha-D-manno-heptose-7-phosphate kinase